MPNSNSYFDFSKLFSSFSSNLAWQICLKDPNLMSCLEEVLKKQNPKFIFSAEETEFLKKIQKISNIIETKPEHLTPEWENKIAEIRILLSDLMIDGFAPLDGQMKADNNKAIDYILQRKGNDYPNLMVMPEWFRFLIQYRLFPMSYQDIYKHNNGGTYLQNLSPNFASITSAKEKQTQKDFFKVVLNLLAADMQNCPEGVCNMISRYLTTSAVQEHLFKSLFEQIRTSGHGLIPTGYERHISSIIDILLGISNTDQYLITTIGFLAPLTQIRIQGFKYSNNYLSVYLENLCKQYIEDLIREEIPYHNWSVSIKNLESYKNLRKALSDLLIEFAKLENRAHEIEARDADNLIIAPDKLMDVLFEPEDNNFERRIIPNATRKINIQKLGGQVWFMGQVIKEMIEGSHKEIIKLPYLSSFLSNLNNAKRIEKLTELNGFLCSHYLQQLIQGDVVVKMSVNYSSFGYITNNDLLTEYIDPFFELVLDTEFSSNDIFILIIKSEIEAILPQMLLDNLIANSSQLRVAKGSNERMLVSFEDLENYQNRLVTPTTQLADKIIQHVYTTAIPKWIIEEVEHYRSYRIRDENMITTVSMYFQIKKNEIITFLSSTTNTEYIINNPYLLGYILANWERLGIDKTNKVFKIDLAPGTYQLGHSIHTIGEDSVSSISYFIDRHSLAPKLFYPQIKIPQDSVVLNDFLDIWINNTDIDILIDSINYKTPGTIIKYLTSHKNKEVITERLSQKIKAENWLGSLDTILEWMYQNQPNKTSLRFIYPEYIKYLLMIQPDAETNNLKVFQESFNKFFLRKYNLRDAFTKFISYDDMLARKAWDLDKNGLIEDLYRISEEGYLDAFFRLPIGKEICGNKELFNNFVSKTTIDKVSGGNFFGLIQPFNKNPEIYAVYVCYHEPSVAISILKTDGQSTSGIIFGVINFFTNKQIVWPGSENINKENIKLYLDLFYYMSNSDQRRILNANSAFFKWLVSTAGEDILELLKLLNFHKRNRSDIFLNFSSEIRSIFIKAVQVSKTTTQDIEASTWSILMRVGLCYPFTQNFKDYQPGFLLKGFLGKKSVPDDTQIFFTELEKLCDEDLNKFVGNYGPLLKRHLLNEEQFSTWAERLTKEQHPNLLAIKGFLRVFKGITNLRGEESYFRMLSLNPKFLSSILKSENYYYMHSDVLLKQTFNLIFSDFNTDEKVQLYQYAKLFYDNDSLFSRTDYISGLDFLLVHDIETILAYLQHPKTNPKAKKNIIKYLSKSNELQEILLAVANAYIPNSSTIKKTTQNLISFLLLLEPDTKFLYRILHELNSLTDISSNEPLRLTFATLNQTQGRLILYQTALYNLPVFFSKVLNLSQIPYNKKVDFLRQLPNYQNALGVIKFLPQEDVIPFLKLFKATVARIANDYSKSPQYSFSEILEQQQSTFIPHLIQNAWSVFHDVLLILDIIDKEKILWANKDLLKTIYENKNPGYSLTIVRNERENAQLSFQVQTVEKKIFNYDTTGFMSYIRSFATQNPCLTLSTQTTRSKRAVEDSICFWPANHPFEFSTITEPEYILGYLTNLQERNLISPELQQLNDNLEIVLKRKVLPEPLQVNTQGRGLNLDHVTNTASVMLVIYAYGQALKAEDTPKKIEELTKLSGLLVASYTVPLATGYVLRKSVEKLVTSGKFQTALSLEVQSAGRTVAASGIAFAFNAYSVYEDIQNLVHHSDTKTKVDLAIDVLILLGNSGLILAEYAGLVSGPVGTAIILSAIAVKILVDNGFETAKIAKRIELKPGIDAEKFWLFIDNLVNSLSEQTQTELAIQDGRENRINTVLKSLPENLLNSFSDIIISEGKQVIELILKKSGWLIKTENRSYINQGEQPNQKNITLTYPFPNEQPDYINAWYQLASGLPSSLELKYSSPVATQDGALNYKQINSNPVAANVTHDVREEQQTWESKSSDNRDYYYLQNTGLETGKILVKIDNSGTNQVDLSNSQHECQIIVNNFGSNDIKGSDGITNAQIILPENQPGYYKVKGSKKSETDNHLICSTSKNGQYTLMDNNNAQNLVYHRPSLGDFTKPTQIGEFQNFGKIVLQNTNLYIEYTEKNPSNIHYTVQNLASKTTVTEMNLSTEVYINGSTTDLKLITLSGNINVHNENPNLGIITTADEGTIIINHIPDTTLKLFLQPEIFQNHRIQFRVLHQPGQKTYQSYYLDEDTKHQIVVHSSKFPEFYLGIGMQIQPEKIDVQGEISRMKVIFYMLPNETETNFLQRMQNFSSKNMGLTKQGIYRRTNGTNVLYFLTDEVDYFFISETQLLDSGIQEIYYQAPASSIFNIPKNCKKIRIKNINPKGKIQISGANLLKKDHNTKFEFEPLRGDNFSPHLVINIDQLILNVYAQGIKNTVISLENSGLKILPRQNKHVGSEGMVEGYTFVLNQPVNQQLKVSFGVKNDGNHGKKLTDSSFSFIQVPFKDRKGLVTSEDTYQFDLSYDLKTLKEQGYEHLILHPVLGEKDVNKFKISRFKNEKVYGILFDITDIDGKQTKIFVHSDVAEDLNFPIYIRRKTKANNYNLEEVPSATLTQAPENPNLLEELEINKQNHAKNQLQHTLFYFNLEEEINKIQAEKPDLRTFNIYIDGTTVMNTLNFEGFVISALNRYTRDLAFTVRTTNNVEYHIKLFNFFDKDHLANTTRLFPLIFMDNNQFILPSDFEQAIKNKNPLVFIQTIINKKQTTTCQIQTNEFTEVKTAQNKEIPNIGRRLLTVSESEIIENELTPNTEIEYKIPNVAMNFSNGTLTDAIQNMPNQPEENLKAENIPDQSTGVEGSEEFFDVTDNEEKWKAEHTQELEELHAGFAAQKEYDHSYNLYKNNEFNEPETSTEETEKTEAALIQEPQTNKNSSWKSWLIGGLGTAGLVAGGGYLTWIFSRRYHRGYNKIPTVVPAPKRPIYMGNTNAFKSGGATLTTAIATNNIPVNEVHEIHESQKHQESPEVLQFKEDWENGKFDPSKNLARHQKDFQDKNSKQSSLSPADQCYRMLNPLPQQPICENPDQKNKKLYYQENVKNYRNPTTGIGFPNTCENGDEDSSRTFMFSAGNVNENPFKEETTSGFYQEKNYQNIKNHLENEVGVSLSCTQKIPDQARRLHIDCTTKVTGQNCDSHLSITNTYNFPTENGQVSEQTTENFVSDPNSNHNNCTAKINFKPYTAPEQFKNNLTNINFDSTLPSLNNCVDSATSGVVSGVTAGFFTSIILQQSYQLSFGLQSYMFQNALNMVNYSLNYLTPDLVKGKISEFINSLAISVGLNTYATGTLSLADFTTTVCQKLGGIMGVLGVQKLMQTENFQFLLDILELDSQFRAKNLPETLELWLKKSDKELLNICLNLKKVNNSILKNINTIEEFKEKLKNLSELLNNDFSLEFLVLFKKIDISLGKLEEEKLPRKIYNYFRPKVSKNSAKNIPISPKDPVNIQTVNNNLNKLPDYRSLLNQFAENYSDVNSTVNSTANFLQRIS